MTANKWRRKKWWHWKKPFKEMVKDICMWNRKLLLGQPNRIKYNKKCRWNRNIYFHSSNLFVSYCQFRYHYTLVEIMTPCRLWRSVKCWSNVGDRLLIANVDTMLGVPRVWSHIPGVFWLLLFLNGLIVFGSVLHWWFYPVLAAHNTAHPSDPTKYRALPWRHGYSALPLIWLVGRVSHMIFCA